MKVRGEKIKFNNRGSSLVFVLIAVAFVAILTAVIVSAATTNYRLKIMNNYSKRTFYNAETALAEVYAGLGKVACDTLENNYLEVAQNLTYRVEEDGTSFVVRVNNEKANAELKQKFYEDLNTLISSQDSMHTLETYLSAFLTNPEKAYVSSYSDIDYDDATCTIVIEDVVVAYKEKDLDYFSTVAVDMEIKYPDNQFDFMDNNKSTLETFLDYAIIAEKGLSIGRGNSASTGTIAGGVYAGTYNNEPGITVGHTSIMKVGKEGLELPSKIITKGDLLCYGDLTYSNAELWCVNLNVSDATSGGAEVVFDKTAAIYLADDLNVEGIDCKVTLGSKFFGFGNRSDASKNSSAIIINGRNTLLKAEYLSKLVVAGRAYIDFQKTSATEYVTGDSLSLRGIQEIYLVPVRYLDFTPESTVTELTNPSSDKKLGAVLYNFFAYELLDDINPYITKEVDGAIYYYLNFKDREAQKTYVNCVLDYFYLTGHISNKGTRAQQDWTELHRIVEDNMEKFMIDGKVILGYAPGAQLYTTGNLYSVQNGVQFVETMSTAQITMACQDKQNRYQIMTSFLYDVGSDTDDTKYSSMPSTIKIDGNTYSTGDVDSTRPYDRIIDTEYVSTLSKNYYNKRSDGKLAAIFIKDDATAFEAGVSVPTEVTGAADGVVTIPVDVIGGVVLAYGLDVVVQSNFEGLIITDGKVYTKTGNNDLVTNGVRDVTSTMLDEDLRLAECFYAYKMDTSDDTRDVSIVDVADILSFNDWRKNYAE